MRSRKKKKKKRERNCDEKRKVEMERRGGCCIAKYGREGGGDYRADVAWKVGRIMLRFRPIAPKPAAAPPVVAAAVMETRATGRARRKAGGGGREGRRGRKVRKIVTGALKEETGVYKEEKKEKLSSSSSESSGAGSGTTVTLPLMPETPEKKADAPPEEVPAVPYVIPAWLRVRDGGAAGGGGGGGGEVVAPRPVRPAGSWVTVECVTDTWREGEVGAAATSGDEVVRAALEADEAFPCFISDAWDRVTWTNEAYRRMVVGREADGEEEGAKEEEEEDVRVALVTRGMVPGATCRAFTCRVRVRYASRRRGRGSLAAPCDVWRMDDGGYAWRLDVRTALSLSLGR